MSTLRLLTAFLLLLPAAAAQTGLLEFQGDAGIDTLGWSVSGGHDVDGDGVPDLALGAPQDALLNSSSPGRVVVVSGATGTELFGMNGVSSLDQLGISVDGVGDVDGDGTPDVVVGASAADPGGAPSAGRVLVLSGVDGAQLLALDGPAAANFFGRSVAGVGDVDGDGTPDLLAGGQGFARVHSGADGALIHDLQHADSSFGFTVAAAGDLDGDGTPDLLVGAPGAGSGGQVLAFDGASGALLHTVSGGVSSAALQGWALAGMGDLTGDGNDDYAVGAPAHIGPGGEQGRVKLISGADGSLVFQRDGAAVGAGLFGDFGDDLDALPDRNGDGLPEILVGAPATADVFVLSGADGAVLDVLTGPVNDVFGDAVATLGDANGDGIADVLVGESGFARAVTLLDGDTGEEIYSFSYGGQGTGENAAAIGDVDSDGVPDFVAGARLSFAVGPGKPGAVQVRSGLDGSTLLALQGAAADDRFGFAVALLGDVTGDGLSELAVGAPNADPGGLVDAGEVTVFSGADGSVVYTLTGAAAGDRLGSSLARLDDLDNDGADDLAAGAPGAGEVRVVAGDTGALFHVLSSGAASFGTSVAAAGDLNGDGRTEIVVGAPLANNQFLFGSAGRVEIFSGLSGALLLIRDGTSQSGEELGRAVAGGIDWNGDGTPDVFAGAPLFDVSGQSTNIGRVRVLSGLDASILATLPGGIDRGLFGAALAVLDDADGDDVDELVVGAPSSDLGGPTNPGDVFVFAGGAGHAQLAAVDGVAFGDRFGFSVASAGDVDGDGVGDLVAGQPGLASGEFAQVGGARVITTAEFPAGVVSFGAGCAASSGLVPVAGTAGGAPFLGNAGFQITLTDATPSEVGFLIVGISRTSWDGVPLPFSLAGAGLPGCTLFVSGDFFINIATNAAGERVVNSPVPNDAGLVGGKLFVQWYVSDPAPGFKPGAVSQAIELEIQP